MIDASGRLLDEMGVPPEILEGLLRDYGSVNAAAREMGMPQATLHSIVNGDNNPRLVTLRLIARNRRMPLWKLVRLMERDSAVAA